MSVRVSQSEIIGSEAPTKTTANVDIYVATTGSDVTGTGAVGAPYASIERAMEDVPEIVDHHVHIHVAAGAYADFPSSIKFRGNGAVSIDALSAMTDVDAGPYTIAGGGVTNVMSYGCKDLTVAGGGLTPNAWVGSFVQMLTGAASGSIFPILENSATVVRICGCIFGAIAPADTFKVIEPGAVVTLAKAKYVVDAFASEDTKLSGLLLMGLKLDNASADIFLKSAYITTLYGSQVVASVRVLGGYLACAPYALPATLCDEPTWTANGDGGAVVRVLRLEGSAVAENLMVDNRAASSGTACMMSGTSRTNFVFAAAKKGAFNAAPNSHVSIDYSLGFADAAENALDLDQGATAYVTNFIAHQGVNGINLGTGAHLVAEGVSGVKANISGYGILVGRGATAVVKKSSASLEGTTNFVGYANGAAAAGYPNQDVVADDGAGARVIGS